MTRAEVERMAHDLRQGWVSGAPPADMMLALLEAKELRDTWLAECVRLSGADTSGGMKGDVDEDWRLAPSALGEVKRMRADWDECEVELTALRAEVARLQRAIERKDAALDELIAVFGVRKDNLYSQRRAIERAYTGTAPLAGDGGGV